MFVSGMGASPWPFGACVPCLPSILGWVTTELGTAGLSLLGQISLWPQGTGRLTVPAFSVKLGVEVSNRHLEPPVQAWVGLQGLELPCSLWTNTNRSNGHC